MAYLPPNPRRVGYIVPINGPLDGPLYMGSIYTNIHDYPYNYSLILCIGSVNIVSRM